MYHFYYPMFLGEMAHKLISILQIPLIATVFVLSGNTCIAQTIINAPPTSIGDRFELNAGETLNVSDGGEAGRFFQANDGSVVNILGGSIGSYFRAHTGSTINISGGKVGSQFSANPGSEVRVSGGSLGGDFFAGFGSVLEMSGGSLGLGVELGPDSELIGGNFQLNGTEFTEHNITLDRSSAPYALFTGTLEDGSPFIFSSQAGNAGDLLQNVKLTRVTVPAPNLTPILIDSPSLEGPLGLRAGQMLTLQSGGQLNDNFTAIDATLHIEGGVVGQNLETVGSQVEISGGEVGFRMSTYAGSELSISGGTIARLDAFETDINVSGGKVTASGIDSSHVNISKGSIGSLFARSGSVVEVAGGQVGDERIRNASINAAPGVEVLVTGGAIGYGFISESGSHIEVVGGEFRVNGNEFNGSTLTPGPEDIISGTLADGSAFIFSTIHGDNLHSLKLTQTSLPPVDMAPTTINRPRIEGPFGLRPNQTLSVQTGGVLPNNYALLGATLNVEGGMVGAGVEMIGSTINISAGSVGAEVASSHLVLNNFSRGLNAIDSVVNMSGGVLGDESVAGRGTVVNLSGGIVGFRFEAQQGSEVQISGGAIGQNFSSQAGSTVELIGGEFRLNGNDYTGSTISLRPGDLFTGTLADGSSFLFRHQPGNGTLSDELNEVHLTRVSLPVLNLTPNILESAVIEGPYGLRTGQELTVNAGGDLRDYFTAIDATLNIEGGRVGDGLEVFDSTVNILGGEVGTRFVAYASEVNISGGTVGGNLFSYPGSVVNITGGTMGSVRAYSDSVLNISGESTMLGGVQGTLGSKVYVSNGTMFSFSTGSFAKISGGTIKQSMTTQNGVAYISGGIFEGNYFVNNSELNISGGDFNHDVRFSTNSVANISGGLFSGGFRADGDSRVNLFGTQFFIDGEPLSDLELGKTFVIPNRDGTLSSLLADGSPFSLLIEAERFPFTLTVTLVPEPTSFSLLAFNCGLLLLRWRTNSNGDRTSSILGHLV